MLQSWATVPAAVLALAVVGLAAAAPGITGRPVILPEPDAADPAGHWGTGPAGGLPSGAGAESAILILPGWRRP